MHHQSAAGWQKLQRSRGHSEAILDCTPLYVAETQSPEVHLSQQIEEKKRLSRLLACIKCAGAAMVQDGRPAIRKAEERRLKTLLMR